MDKVKKEKTRLGYGEGLVILGKENKDVVVLDADLSKSTMTYMFAKEFPDRFFDMGISEQDMLGTAAGLSIAGKIPFVSTYGVFVAGRAYDQIRTTIAYGNLNVKIGGAHGGISVGKDGPTHQALEEIALMRSLPNLTVIVPADYIETRKATIAAAKINGPVYIRFGREKVPIVTNEDTPFEVGKGMVYKEGKDISLIACGIMLYESLVAAEMLEKDGISARVINIHTVKPIDREIIIKAAQETGAIVASEEHQMYAGFSSAVAEVVVQNWPVPMEFVGVQDKFGESGDPEQLLKAYGLSAENIYNKAKKVLERKKKHQLV